MPKLTHVDDAGSVQMVNVREKAVSHRIAIAAGRIYMQTTTLRLIRENKTKKGDVLAVARTAGIMAAKKTAELIPLCHPLRLTHIDITLDMNKTDDCIECQCRTETEDRTGVEMEALLSVQIALLTIYDMCKAVDRGMTLSEIKLLHKSGGQSGYWDCD